MRRVLRDLLVASLLFATVDSHALEPRGPECEALSEADFRALVASAQRALDTDDLLTHARAAHDIEDRVACLDGQIPKDAWAEYLVTVAVIEYAVGDAWQEPLRTALRIHPTVDRQFTPEAIKSYQAPPPPPSTGEALPAGITWMIDGLVVSERPVLDGVHVVQRFEGGVWTSRYVRGDAFPVELLGLSDDTRRPSADAPRAVNGRFVLLLGGGGYAQQPSVPGDWITEHTAASFVTGLQITGDVTVVGPLGLFWDLAAPLPVQLKGVGEIYVGTRLALGGAGLLLGVGASGIHPWKGDHYDGFTLAQPHLGIELPVPLSPKLGLELRGGTGLWANGHHLGGAIDLLPTATTGSRWTTGLVAGWTHGRFDTEDGRTLGANRTYVALLGGLRFGR